MLIRLVLDDESEFLGLVAVDLLEEARLLGGWLNLDIAALGCFGLLLLAGAQPAHKAINLASGVNNALLASVVWVALGAHINTHVIAG